MILINLASRDDADLCSYDVKGAFLHAQFGPLDEVTYLRIPKDLATQWAEMDPDAKKFIDEKGELTLELDRFIYGLKQSPYKFQMHLKATLTAAGYISQEQDDCLFVKWNGDKYSVLSTHVDDILQVTTCPRMREELHAILLKTYGDIVYHPKADAYVGLSINRSEDGKTFDLSQRGLVEKVIKEYLKPEDKTCVNTPATDSLFHTEQTVLSKPVNTSLYLSMIMKLMYLARLSRPDILLAVTHLATRSHCATEEDWKHGLRIIRYLRGTIDETLTVDCTSLDISIICDAAYASHTDGKSHSGYAITCGSKQSMLLCRSNKQKLVAQSSTEAELFAMTDALKQAVWLRNIIRGLGVSPLAPITLYQDNKSSIIITNGLSQCRNVKHILTKIAFAIELTTLGALDIEYLNTSDMWADMLTKPLGAAAFQKHRSRLLCKHPKGVQALTIRLIGLHSEC
jgi:uncharacterized protein YlbG (UPF0298 family)